MNYKNLMIAALAVLILGSCSKDDNIPGTDPNITGQATYMKVSVATVKANTKAYYDLSVTEEESTIEELKLYVFNGSGETAVYETHANLTLADRTTESTTNNDVYEKTVKITTGNKVFLVAANLSYCPAGYPNATTLAQAREELLSIAATADAATDNQFWMTSTEDTERNISKVITESAANAGDNLVVIDLGRAVAKVGVYFNESTVSSNETTGGSLDAATVEYKVGNNPKKMFTFTSNVAGTGYLNTPLYAASILTIGFNSENYFKDTGYRRTGLNIDSYHEYPYYMVENSNEIPKHGNATFVYIKGKFVPSPSNLYSADGTSGGTLNPDGDFWRAYDPVLEVYGSKFYSAEPSAEVIAEEGTRFTQIVEYNEGLAYYSLYLKNGNTALTTIERYTVKRNNYWSVEITSVKGCGHNEEGKVDPSNPAGPDPDEPLEDETYIRAEITVKKWDGVAQSGGI